MKHLNNARVIANDQLVKRWCTEDGKILSQGKRLPKAHPSNEDYRNAIIISLCVKKGIIPAVKALMKKDNTGLQLAYRKINQWRNYGSIFAPATRTGL